MTLNQAVAILNEKEHGFANGEPGHTRHVAGVRDMNKWYVAGDALVRGSDEYEAFSAFEAIAIAEKYAKGDRPDR